MNPITLDDYDPVSPSPDSAVTSPDWLPGAVIYEAFPRAYGKSGTLDEITGDLGRLQALGITCLWLMPIHPVGVLRRKGARGSPYAVRDHKRVDPALGGRSSLRVLVERAHERGMKVILDWVAGHCAWDNLLVDLHPDWFHRLDGREPHPPMPEWGDVVAFDYRATGVWAYMLDAMRYWVSEFDIDGYRCDVAGMVPLDFWEEAREGLKAIKPDVLLLAEAEGAAFHRSAFDLTYDWTLYEQIGAVYGGAPAQSLVETASALRGRDPAGARRMRFVENHDTPRAAARFGPSFARSAAAFLLLADGTPLVHAGQEVGVTHTSSLFARDPIPFADGDPDLARVVARWAGLRRENRVLQTGDLIPIRTRCPRAVAAFARRIRGAHVVVMINFSGRTQRVYLEDAALRARTGLDLLEGQPARLGDLKIPPHGALAIDIGR